MRVIEILATHRWGFVLVLLLLALTRPSPSRAEPSLETTRLAAVATCTAMACPGDSCCNACSFGGWADPKRGLSAVAARGTPKLPACAIDGCGRCSFTLVATGSRRGERFVVTSWTKERARTRW